MNQLIIKKNSTSSSGIRTIEERRWELLKGVKKSLEELLEKERENNIENQEIKRFI